MKFVNSIIFTAALSASVFYFSSVHAASLIACDPRFDVNKSIISQCGLCELGYTVQNVVDFMFKDLAIPLGGIMIIVGGLMIMTAGESSSRLENGKNTLRSAVIGVILTLGSWIIVNSFLSVLANMRDPSLANFFNGWKDLKSSGLCQNSGGIFTNENPAGVLQGSGSSGINTGPGANTLESGQGSAGTTGGGAASQSIKGGPSFSPLPSGAK